MTQPTPWLLEPVLSPRLVLRPRRDTAADRAAVTELLTDPQVQQYLGGPHPAGEVMAALAEPAGERWGSFLAELRQGDGAEEGAVIGECMLSYRFGELEVGYLFLPRYWGRGLAGEAVATILAWAAEHLDDGHVTAVTQAANTASCRLLTRLGFVERERFVRYDADQIRFSAPLAGRQPHGMDRDPWRQRVLATGIDALERLVCHPELPLVASLDRDRPTVRIWDLRDGANTAIGVIDDDAPAYATSVMDEWEDRHERTPSVAWHPHDSVLLVSGRGALRRWTPDGLSMLDDAWSATGHVSIAFDADGEVLWASPAQTGAEEDDWLRSEVLNLRTAARSVGPGWDTGIVHHPGGGLVVTLQSDQGATACLFARSGDDRSGALRPMQRVLVLDCDAYQTPVISPDGRFLAVRGNAYENRIDVFEFPTLRRVLVVALSEPDTDHPSSEAWMAQYRSWSQHHLAFAPATGTLLIGSPDGTILEIDVQSAQQIDHPVFDDARVAAMTVTAGGEIVVAGDHGTLVLLAGAGPAPAETCAAAGERVRTFLAATTFLPADTEALEADDLTDGTTDWTQDDLVSVSDTAATDPTWLQIRAAVNTAVKDGRPSA